MSWFQPITGNDPNAGSAYWGSPFGEALAGMSGFVAGQEQAAAARAAAEQQRLENERAAQELADKRRQTDIKAGRLQLDREKMAAERRGEAEDQAAEDAALLELELQVNGLLEAARAGDGAAAATLRLEAGMDLTSLEAALYNPGPATDAAVALAVQVYKGRQLDKNLSETDELHVRTTNAAMHEYMRRRAAGEQISLSGPGYLELREAARQRLLTEEQRAKEAARPAGAEDREPSPGELAAARIIEIMTEDPADPRGFQQRVSSSIEAYGVAGLEPGEAPPGSIARTYLESTDLGATERAVQINRARKVFADLSNVEMAKAARILDGALSADAMAEINVLPAGGDPAAAVLGP